MAEHTFEVKDMFEDLDLSDETVMREYQAELEEQLRVYVERMKNRIDCE